MLFYHRHHHQHLHSEKKIYPKIQLLLLLQSRPYPRRRQFSLFIKLSLSELNPFFINKIASLFLFSVSLRGVLRRAFAAMVSARLLFTTTHRSQLCCYRERCLFCGSHPPGPQPGKQAINRGGATKINDRQLTLGPGSLILSKRVVFIRFVVLPVTRGKNPGRYK